MKRLLVSLFTVIMLVWTFTVYAADLTDGLVLYMPLDEGKGQVVEDLSDNGLKGEFRGSPKWVDGQYGKALQFSGSSNFVSIADNEVLHISKEITQAAWINLDRLPSAHAIIFGTRSGGGRNIGFGYGMNPSNNIKVWTNNAGGGFLDINDTKTKLETGKWYHLAYTHTTDNKGLVEIYVDGEVTHSQQSNNPVDPAGAPNQVTIGTWSGEAWPGVVDEVKLWSRALSATEVKQSMEVGTISVQPGGKLATSWGSIKTFGVN